MHSKTPRLLLALLLSILTITAPLTSIRVSAQATTTQAAPADLSPKLHAIERAIDDKRKELGVPGASLVIVKDDKVIYMKGLGVKDYDHKITVTPDTLFAIGSATKAFTSLAAMMLVDEGKLALDDSPKKYLPYFKMRDPETDANITIRDLLSHRSGLNRTDLAMATGKLSREELIQVAGQAKPTAKLREKFQYQNIMYTAAGEIVARTQRSTWDKVVADKIFKPLGMSATNTTIQEMEKSKDFSLGYDYNSTTKETRRLPMRDIAKAAPTGAINSNARDMAQWLRFMLGDGTFNGKRLVSEKSFAELTTKQIEITGNVSYGLGWFLRSWDGHKVIEHGGNIDGFNAQVAMMPDQKLGFVLLTNVTGSNLVNFAMTTVWSNLVGRKEEKVPAESEVGKYHFAQANIDFEVSMKDGVLTLTVPGQPPYPLENLSGRRYKLGAPAPDGFFATFRPIQGKENETEMFLEQPHGDWAVPKVKADAASKPATVSASASATGLLLAEVIGKYESDQPKLELNIEKKCDEVVLVVGAQPPYPLVEKEKDKLGSTALPDSYWLDVRRDGSGKVSGIVMNQPEGKLALRRVVETKASITVDELLSKMIAAYGGEENLRKHKSSVTTIEIDMEHQGVLGHGYVKAKAPGMFASHITLTALGKNIGTIDNYFDGSAGGQLISFAPEEIFTGNRLEDMKREAGFFGPLSWKSSYKTLTIKGMAKVGDEEAYILEKLPEKGTKVVDYVSTKTSLVIRRDTVILVETSNIELPQTEYYMDYRSVEGTMVPFLTRSNNIANGDVVTRVKDLKFDVDLPDSDFRKPIVALKTHHQNPTHRLEQQLESRSD